MRWLGWRLWLARRLRTVCDHGQSGPHSYRDTIYAERLPAVVLCPGPKVKR